MHTSYTVGVTTGQFLALKTVMVDQQEWIQNAIDARANTATKKITINYTNYKVGICIDIKSYTGISGIRYGLISF